jgi:hypothetical protein
MVDVGPMACFISRHSIPSDMEFDPDANPPCYKTKDEEMHIQQGNFRDFRKLQTYPIYFIMETQLKKIVLIFHKNCDFDLHLGCAASKILIFQMERLSKNGKKSCYKI